MTGQRLTDVIRSTRLVAGVDHQGRTDCESLAAFATRNDQAAFAALVRRHGPMVMGVCRRVLHHLQDAEDAFQATFLLLAQRSASIHKHESLASWLYGAAYRMAHNARRAASRRRRHEGAAQPALPEGRPAGLEWREVQAILDDEIARLPEIYRAPFVLFYLENQKQTDIARQLGVQEGTVWSRLAHARRLLQGRLARRDVALPAVLGLLAVSAEAASAAVSRSLVSSVAQAATRSAADGAGADVASAEVMALLRGARPAVTAGKCKIATLFLLAAGVVGTGFGFAPPRPPTVRATEMPREEAPPAQPTAPAAARPGAPDNKESKAKEGVEVRGRVLDPDGRPVVGAKLYLRAGDKEGADPLTATSNGDGHFAFPPQPAGTPPFKVLAVAKGFGCAWASVGSANKELTLRLVKDAAVSGRIVDADGRPVANAKLTVDGVAAFKGAKKSGVEFAHTVPFDGYPWGAADGWVGPLPNKGGVLTTSADGRFELTGVGPDRIVSLRLEGPGIATTDLGVISGAPVQHVAATSRPIRGVVRDKATGRPLAGATVAVKIWRFNEPRWGKTVTDKDGRYELLGLAKAPAYGLMVKPAKGQLYFWRDVELEDTPGLAALTADIDMVQGVTVRGKLTDAATHKPIAGARVDYYPLFGNPHVSGAALAFGATTEPDGSYTLTAHPGPGVIGVIGRNPDAYMPALVTNKELNDFFSLDLPDRTGGGRFLIVPSGVTGGNQHPLLQAEHNALVLLEPKAGDKALAKDIALERSLERKGRVVGPDGQPILGVTVLSGLSPRQDSRLARLEGADFTVRGINPRAKRQIVFHHAEKNLGYCLKELPEEKLEPLTIKLQPCGSVSGRIVDADGVPVVTNTRIYLGDREGSQRLIAAPDKDGRFRVNGLVPGLEYHLINNKTSTALSDGILAEPGRDKDLGDIKVSDN